MDNVQAGVLGKLRGVLGHRQKSFDDGRKRSGENVALENEDWDSDYVCTWCSDIPTVTLHSSLKLSRRVIVAEGLLQSRCRICRLIASAIPLYYYQKGEHHLSWIGPHAAIPGIAGTLVLTPAIDNRAEGGNSIAVVTVIPSSYKALPKVVQKLNPERVDIGVVKQWMQSCYQTPYYHLKCKSESRSTLQAFRVIDCTTRQIIPAPTNCAFNALSYVWGEVHEPAHMEEFKLPPKLPRTVEDSIALTMKLGMQYLWVDRYCINQTVAMDKHTQIQQMGAIYGAAQLTIIAASGKDSSAGLPGTTKARRAVAVEHIGSLTLIPHLTDGLAEIRDSVWATRAWTFQEGFLSRRRLFFTDRQAVYICTASVYSESGSMEDYTSRISQPGPLSSLLPSDQNKRSVQPGEHILAPAMTLLEEYTKRSLSYDSDALNAIVGALKTLQSLSQPIHHIWGVPFVERQYIHHGPLIQIALQWFHYQPSIRRMGFPSWSWLGWQGPATFHRKDQPLIPSECDIRIPSNNAFHELRLLMADTNSAHPSLYLQVSALVTQLSFVSVQCPEGFAQHGSKLYIAFPWAKVKGLNKAFEVCVPPLWDRGSPPSTDEHASIVFALLCGDPRAVKRRESCILLLLQHKGPHYERIGYVEYPKGEASNKDCVPRVVRLKEFVDQRDESLKGEGEKRELWLRKKGEMSRLKDESWARNSCWVQCEPTWLNGATRKTFLLG
ncbi:heterokaryon incompatibility protein-domain-containing protein [Pyrenochaeta sp. MPI-SDFR-AT-0127]|nr:heterokaryon incompatibility protein-domain-containing protein [Pyrenochaeta sp. MPI-SDFR-AT-0127]